MEAGDWLILLTFLCFLLASLSCSLWTCWRNSSLIFSSNLCNLTSSSPCLTSPYENILHMFEYVVDKFLSATDKCIVGKYLLLKDWSSQSKIQNHQNFFLNIFGQNDWTQFANLYKNINFIKENPKNTIYVK
jgi:hypothetical protein